MAIIDGGSGSDTLLGSPDDDLLRGFGGDDFLRGVEGADTLDGGTGEDMAAYDGGLVNSGTGVVVNLSNNLQTVANVIYAPSTALDRYGSIDVLIGIEQARGGGGADVFFGSSGYAFFQGRGGADTYIGGHPVLYAIEGPYGGQYNWVDYRQDGGPSGVDVDLKNGTGTDTFGNIEVFANIVALRGTHFADTLRGDQYFNLFQPLDGADTVDGREGRDLVDYSFDARFGGTNPVYVNLATGIATDGFGSTDTLLNIDQVRGTAGNDTIIGSANDESLLRGDEGDDLLVGGGGRDFFRPGLGSDTVDAAPGAEGDDSFADIDFLSYTELGVGTDDLGVIVNFGTDDIVVEGHTVAGGSARDIGGSIDLLIDVEGVAGTGGRDYLRGANQINGTFESFAGHRGNDTIDGGSGLSAADYLSETGSQLLIVNLSNAAITVDGVSVQARTVRDTWGTTDFISNINMIIGTTRADYIRGSERDDILRSYGGADTIDGGFGTHDRLQINALDGTNGVTGPGANIDLAAGFGTTWLSPGVMILQNIEDVTGSTRDDVIQGNDSSNWLFGDTGNDTVGGGGGADIVWGGPGDNNLSGGSGFDYVAFNFDLTRIADLNRRGLFTDPIVPEGAVVDLATGSASNGLGGTDIFSGFEGVFGSYLSDVLRGDAADNWFRGLMGDDTIDGRDGNDSVSYSKTGGGGDISIKLIPGQNASIPNGVVVDLAAGTAADGEGGTDTLISIENVYGSLGNDVLVGDAGANGLSGGEGDDILTGGGGDDVLDGGLGTNTAVYSGLRSAYVITNVGVSWTVDDLRGAKPDGVDTLTNIRFVQFSDTTLDLAQLVNDTSRVVDGYIAGATVFRDTNNNGILDNGEVFTISADDGSFVLDGTGPLVATGGIDTSTGLPFSLKLTASSGDVLSPLTTLIDRMTVQGIADAEAVLAGALGLGAGAEIYGFDPLSASVLGDERGTQLLAAGIQIASTANLIAASLAGTGAGAQTIGNEALTAIAAQFAQGTVDLTDADVLTTLVNETASMASVTTEAAFVANAGFVIAGVNAALALEAAGQGEQGGSALALAKISAVAQTNVAAVLGAANGDADVLSSTMGAVFETGLANLIASTFLGTDAKDVITGTPANDTINGFSGDDRIMAGDGDDIVDGGVGVDRAAYEITRSGAVLQKLNGVGYELAGSAVGTDQLISIERVDFLDGTLVLDASGIQISLAATLKNQIYQPMDSAALVYRLYAAAYARTPDEGGFVYWADRVLDGDVDAATLAQQFRVAPEFIAKYGDNLSDRDYTDKLYSNVLLRPSDIEGLNFWTEHLTTGYFTRDQLMVAFAVSPENIANTIPNISNGYWVV